MPEVVVTGQQDSVHAPEVSTATLIKADPVEIPLSVEVVPQQLMQDRNATSFYDTLQYVSGMYTGGNSAFTATAGRPSIRGYVGNDVMLDGMVLPARMPIFFDAVGISRIEFNKGPLNSVQGGQGGMQGSGGAVNIIKKTADLSGTMQQASLGGTFGNGSSERLTYEPNLKITDDMALRLAMSYTNDRPYYLPTSINDGQNVFLSPVLNWRLTSATTATFAVTYQQSDKASYQGIPYLVKNFLVPVDKYYGTDDTRDRYKGTTVQGKVDHHFTDALKLSIGGGYARADEERNHWSVLAGAPQGSGLTTESYYNKVIATRTAPYSYTRGDWQDTNLSAFAHLNYDLKLSVLRNQMTLGIDWLRRGSSGSSTSANTGWQSLDNPNLVIPKLTPMTVTDTKVNRYGLILQDFISWEKWRFLIGARLDSHESSYGHKASAVSPRFGLTYLIRPDFAAYANYNARGRAELRLQRYQQNRTHE